jgi:hypothetical protein
MGIVLVLPDMGPLAQTRIKSYFLQSIINGVGGYIRIRTKFNVRVLQPILFQPLAIDGITEVLRTFGSWVPKPTNRLSLWGRSSGFPARFKVTDGKRAGISGRLTLYDFLV